VSDSVAKWPAKGTVSDATLAALTAIAIAVVAISFAFFVATPRIINPFDTSWPSDDASNAYLGWKFFRNEEHLTFPLGWSSAIGFPIGEAIAYLDSIPLVAMMFWPLRHILPVNFQYQGLFFAVNCVLQLYFGYRISRRLSDGNRLAGLAGGLLFMTAPPFVAQSSGHFTLSGHWLILAALDIFFAVTPRLDKSSVLLSVILCFLVGGIHPYLTFMVVLVLGAAALRMLLLTGPGSEVPLDRRFFASASWLLICVAVTLASLTLFGFLQPFGSTAYADIGFGYYSMNILAPINPMVARSLLFAPLPRGPGQYEGYNYLGLGIIALGVVALACRPSALGKLFTRKAVAVWAIVVPSLLLALSNKATAGSLVVYDVTLPNWLLNILSVLRASGRLFWPVYYLVLAGVIAAASGIVSGRKLALLLFATFLLQVADLTGLYAFLHARQASRSSSAFTDSGPWQTLGRDHRHLVIVPAWQCGFAQSPGGKYGFWIFGKIAAQQNMTINSFYPARRSAAEQDFFCNRQPATLARDGLDESTAYVFANMAQITPLKLRSHYCRPLDGVVLCTMEGRSNGVDDTHHGHGPATVTTPSVPSSAPVRDRTGLK
jgi:hypothetical protein